MWRRPAWPSLRGGRAGLYGGTSLVERTNTTHSSSEVTAGQRHNVVFLVHNLYYRSWERHGRQSGARWQGGAVRFPSMVGTVTKESLRRGRRTKRGTENKRERESEREREIGYGDDQSCSPGKWEEHVCTAMQPSWKTNDSEHPTDDIIAGQQHDIAFPVEKGCIRRWRRRKEKSDARRQDGAIACNSIMIERGNDEKGKRWHRKHELKMDIWLTIRKETTANSPHGRKGRVRLMREWIGPSYSILSAGKATRYAPPPSSTYVSSCYQRGSGHGGNLGEQNELVQATAPP